MREIQSHKVNAANDAISITADEYGQGNMSHVYDLAIGTDPADGQQLKNLRIAFQNGPVKEVGVNGVTNEALLAIVIDRLRGAQAGPYSCRENALALTKLEEGVMWLLERTRGRVARGVEGTHEK